MYLVSILLLLPLYLSHVTASVQSNQPDHSGVYTIEAAPWPEADALFRKDPRWLGGDDAYSVDLGEGRVLWLFADSFIATSLAGVRREARMVRNSVAIQKGYDPTSATIRFYWRAQDGKPASFFRESKGAWYWPGHGIRLGKTLLVFLMEVRRTSKGLGFEVFGWKAVAIRNPNEEPSRWRVRWLNVPRNDFGVIVGSASILRIGEYVYAFGAEEPGIHNVYVVRWHVSRAIRGDLREPEWWTDGADGWTAQSLLSKRPAAVFSGGQTEFTVHYEQRLKRFIQVQTEGFGAADMAVRWANSLTGPWSVVQRFYRPSESGRADAFVYAGKSHPELTGADLVLTYVANSMNFGQLISDTNIYYPRFLRGRIIEK